MQKMSGRAQSNAPATATGPGQRRGDAVLGGTMSTASLTKAWAGIVWPAIAWLSRAVTLSFLFTTPEAWVPALGDSSTGFPFLSGAGRLVLKDVMLLAGGFLLMVGSARAILRER